MYYIFGEPVETLFKGIKKEANSTQIINRGWEKNLRPDHDLLLPVYTIAGKYCPTSRDVFLQYVKKMSVVPNKAMISGRLYHAILEEIFPTAKEYIYNNGIIDNFDLYSHMAERGKKVIDALVIENRKDITGSGFYDFEIESIKNRMWKLWRFQTIQIIAAVDLILSKFKHIDRDALVAAAIPLTVEQKLDGSIIGLSKNLSIDALHTSHTVVMDVKTGRPHKFHKLTTTGYALAYESQFKQPVNIGCIVYPSFREEKPVPIVNKNLHVIDDQLRTEFIKERNKKFEIILTQKDPGVTDRCPPECSFYNICHSKD